MAWGFVQSAASAATGTATSKAVTFSTANLSSGTKLIALTSLFINGGNTTVTSVKDGAGNSFTLIGRVTYTAGDVALWAMDTPSGDVGTKPTITATLGLSATCSILVQEVSGLAVGNTTAAMIDGTLASLNGNGGSSTGSPAYTSTAASEYLLAAYGDTGGPTTWTKPAALTADPASINSNGDDDVALAYGNSTNGAEAGSWALGGTGTTWGALLVAFQIASGGGSPSITTTSLPVAYESALYSATLAATGGTPGYTWSISSGSLPGWASLNASTGVISGTPNAVASTTFTVEVTDSASATATQPLTITVTPRAPVSFSDAVPQQMQTGFVPGTPPAQNNVAATAAIAGAGAARATATVSVRSLVAGAGAGTAQPRIGVTAALAAAATAPASAAASTQVTAAIAGLGTAAAAPPRVYPVYTGAAGGGSGFTVPISTGTGDGIVLTCNSNDTTGAACTDSQGNTYVVVSNFTADGTCMFASTYNGSPGTPTKALTGGVDTITPTGASIGGTTMVVGVRGIAPQAADASPAYANGNSGTATGNATGVLANAADIIVSAVLGTWATVAAGVSAWGDSLAQVSTIASAGNGNAMAWKQVTSTASDTPSATLASSQIWIVHTVALLPFGSAVSVNATAAIAGQGSVSVQPVISVTAAIAGQGSAGTVADISGSAVLAGQGSDGAQPTIGTGSAASGSGSAGAGGTIGAPGAIAGQGTAGSGVIISVTAHIAGSGSAGATGFGTSVCTASIAGQGSAQAGVDLLGSGPLGGAGTASAGVIIGVLSAITGHGTAGAGPVIGAPGSAGGSGTAGSGVIISVSASVAGTGGASGSGGSGAGGVVAGQGSDTARPTIGVLPDVAGQGADSATPIIGTGSAASGSGSAGSGGTIGAPGSTAGLGSVGTQPTLGVTAGVAGSGGASAGPIISAGAVIAGHGTAGSGVIISVTGAASGSGGCSSSGGGGHGAAVVGYGADTAQATIGVTAPVGASTYQPVYPPTYGSGGVASAAPTIGSPGTAQGAGTASSVPTISVSAHAAGSGGCSSAGGSGTRGTLAGQGSDGAQPIISVTAAVAGSGSVAAITPDLGVSAALHGAGTGSAQAAIGALATIAGQGSAGAGIGITGSGPLGGAGSAAGTATIGVVSATAIWPPGKVVRSGTSLLKDGVAWRLIGFNMWRACIASWNHPANYDGYEQNTGTNLATDLANVQATAPHVNTIRVWFFQQFANNSGTRDWSAMDKVLSVCAAAGVKVIACLQDNWSYEVAGTQNPQKSTTWFSTDYATTTGSTLPYETVSYRAWVAEIVARYAGDPRIAVWELLNEGNNETAAWLTDVAGLVKSIDPVTPVGDGMGDTNGTLAAVSSMDVPSYHYYTDYSQTAYAAMASTAYSAGKPSYLGEAGFDTSLGLSTRAADFAALLSPVFTTPGIAGFIAWQWPGSGSGDGFNITTGDPMLPVLDGYAVPGGVANGGTGTASSGVIISVNATLAGTGGVTNSGGSGAGGSLAGHGSDTAQPTIGVSAGVAGGGTASATATIASPATAQLQGIGTAGAQPIISVGGAAAGLGSMGAQASGTGAALAGQGSDTAQPTIGVTGTAVGAGSASATATIITLATATIAGQGTAGAVPVIGAPAAASGAGAASASATVSYIYNSAAAAIAGTGSAKATASVISFVLTQLTGAGQALATAQLRALAAAGGQGSATCVATVHYLNVYATGVATVINPNPGTATVTVTDTSSGDVTDPRDGEASVAAFATGVSTVTKGGAA